MRWSTYLQALAWKFHDAKADFNKIIYCKTGYFERFLLFRK